MFVCVECGCVFEKPQHIVERHGLDTPPYEEFDGCPSCCGGCIAEAHACNGCGQYIIDRYIQLDGGERYCDDCYTVKDLDS